MKNERPVTTMKCDYCGKEVTDYFSPFGTEDVPESVYFYGWITRTVKGKRRDVTKDFCSSVCECNFLLELLINNKPDVEFIVMMGNMYRVTPITNALQMPDRAYVVPLGEVHQILAKRFTNIAAIYFSCKSFYVMLKNGSGYVLTLHKR